ncbi:MAG: hypothetical protein Q4C02_09750, partial [Eubacteriales bacterium]|nr:hypothetical protein [Eubacteriales bacterium]
SDGNVTAIGVGTATITAMATSGVSSESQVTVRNIVIDLPILPESYSYSGGSTTYSTCDIEKIEIDKTRNSDTTYSVEVMLYGTKTYDNKPTTSSSCKVGYKLYDANDYVVKSGTFYSDSVFPNEKFKGSFYLFSLEDGEYRLELLNVTN